MGDIKKTFYNITDLFIFFLKMLSPISKNRLIFDNSEEISKPFIHMSYQLSLHYGEVNVNDIKINQTLEFTDSGQELYQKKTSPLRLIGKKRNNLRPFLFLGPLYTSNRDHIRLIALINHKGTKKLVDVTESCCKLVLKKFDNYMYAIVEFKEGQTSRTLKSKCDSIEDIQFSFLVVNPENGRIDDMSYGNFSWDGYYKLRTFFFYIRGSEGNSEHKRNEKKRRIEAYKEKRNSDKKIKINEKYSNMLNRIEFIQEKINVIEQKQDKFNNLLIKFLDTLKEKKICN